MNKHRLPLVLGLLAALYFSGCATHEPLPRLSYTPATPMGQPSSAPRTEPVPTGVTFEAGESIGHSLTSYALMPGGYAMPITSSSTSAVAFNTEDQAAFVENLARVLTERGVIKLAGTDMTPAANVTVKFLKIEHFPEMQDYVLDALVTAHAGNRAYDKVYHISTIDQVNLVARMFQHAIDGRRRAAESLLAAVVPDLQGFFTNSSTAVASAPGAIVIPQPFETCAPEIARFLIEHYARPSTFWKAGISVYADKLSPTVAVIELRWSDSDALPPFCSVDIYAAGANTRLVIRERNTLLTARAHVAEALQEYAGKVQMPPSETGPAKRQD